MRERKAFTLIEVLLVICIMALLLLVSFTSWFNLTGNISSHATLKNSADAVENILIKVRYDSFQKKDALEFTIDIDSVKTADITYTLPDHVTFEGVISPISYYYNRGYLTEKKATTYDIIDSMDFTLTYEKGEITQSVVLNVNQGSVSIGDVK